MRRPGVRRCAARYAEWKTVPAPASVTPSSARKSTVVTGSKDSTQMQRQPTISALKSKLEPPMWANGKTMAMRSSPLMRRRSTRIAATVPSVPSLCSTPLGSEVLPDV